jgi:hypothetical protein
MNLKLEELNSLYKDVENVKNTQLYLGLPQNIKPRLMGSSLHLETVVFVFFAPPIPLPL